MIGHNCQNVWQAWMTCSEHLCFKYAACTLHAYFITLNHFEPSVQIWFDAKQKRVFSFEQTLDENEWLISVNSLCCKCIFILTENILHIQFSGFCVWIILINNNKNNNSTDYFVTSTTTFCLNTVISMSLLHICWFRREKKVITMLRESTAVFEMHKP